MRANYKDVATGGIFILVGLFYGGTTLAQLPVGNALRMGPGYFPLLLSGVAVFLGLLTLYNGVKAGGGTAIGAWPWRAMITILAALLFFALAVDALGLAPTVLITVAVAAMAYPGTKPHEALAVGATMAIGCSIVFLYFLGLPLTYVGAVFGPLSF